MEQNPDYIIIMSEDRYGKMQLETEQLRLAGQLPKVGKRHWVKFRLMQIRGWFEYFSSRFHWHSKMAQSHVRYAVHIASTPRAAYLRDRHVHFIHRRAHAR